MIIMLQTTDVSSAEESCLSFPLKTEQKQLSVSISVFTFLSLSLSLSGGSLLALTAILPLCHFGLMGQA